MSTERTELIIRLPGLTAEQAEIIAVKLAPLVKRFGGKMSAVEREHHEGYAIHKRRRRLV